MGRLVAGLAVKAAGEAAETVDVGPPGVVGYPPGLGVKWVLLVDVVVLSVPGGRGSRKETDGVNERRAGRGRKEGVHDLAVCNGESWAEPNTAPDEVLTCCPLASRAGRRRTA